MAILASADDKLEWLLHDGLDTDQYEQAKSFPGTLEQEARNRLADGTRKP